MSKQTEQMKIMDTKKFPAFVTAKTQLLMSSEFDMKALYRLMFSEEENVIGESTDGYRIRKTTYGECRAEAERVAARLNARLNGVPKGTLVGIYLDNSLEWIECFWGVLIAGYKPLLMNMRLPDDVLDKSLSDYGVCAVISVEKQFSVKNIALSSLFDGEEQAVDPDVFENEIYLMSSNTSGNLKICCYTGKELCYQLKDSPWIFSTNRYISGHYNGSLKLLAFLPFYHIFGLVAVFVWFCYFSRTVVFLKNMNPKTIIGTIKKHEVTHIFAVPLFWETVYRSALAEIKRRGDKTYRKFLKGMKLGEVLGERFKRSAFREIREGLFGDSVQFLISGGGYISPDIVKFMNGIGYCMVNGYGMTELGIVCVELSEKAKERNLCSVGKPFSVLEHSINGDGELLVRGKSISHKIYSHGEATLIGDDEWFNTHDIFEVRGGRFYISGRKDDLIIGVNGENFNPDLLEEKLVVPGVERLCMLPSAAGGKLLIVAEVKFCLTKNALESTRAAIEARAKAHNMSAVTDKILLTTTPLIGAGDFKVNRKKIAAKLKSGELHIINFDRVEEEIAEQDKALMQRITHLFAAALNRSDEEILPDANFFFDLGGSSLDYFTMITSVQSEFNVSFPANGGVSVSTVRETLAYLRQHS